MTDYLLKSMDTAPLDGSHIMVVFKREWFYCESGDAVHNIREAWVKNKTTEYEFLSDSGDYLDIHNPIGWFNIPDFDIEVNTLDG